MAIIVAKEEQCIILDFLPHGYPDRRHAESIAQAIGTTYFTLLELVPREGVDLAQGQKAYIGEGKREEIKFIKGMMDYNHLTNMAQNYLPEAVELLIADSEKKIVEFFNKAGPITPRMHSLDLMPGIGKKLLLELLEARRKKPFENLQDIEERVKLFPDVRKTVVRRIMNELKFDEKYYLFVAKKQKRY
jgi:putative nucleotide binding protein